MRTTEAGTSVGVADPYEHVDRCDHVTDDGRCRYARDHGGRDPEFADRLAANDFVCPVVATAAAAADEADGADDVATLPAETDLDADALDWDTCPHFCCRIHDRECHRCGLEEHRLAHDDERPLLEEHHLAYDDEDDLGHEITVYLCRWCHAKVHNSWAAIDDDASPDPEAIAAREGRKDAERAELAFDSATERYEDDD